MPETPTTLFDLWRRQLEDGTQAWLRTLGPEQFLDPQAFWRPFMDHSMVMWSQLMTQGIASPDLMAQWKQFLDEWIAAWAKVLEQAMSTDVFARMMGTQLETFLQAGGPVKKAAEQQLETGLATLGMPSRSQVVSLATQLVHLEEKLERLEDRLDAIWKRLNEPPAPRGSA